MKRYGLAAGAALTLSAAPAMGQTAETVVGGGLGLLIALVIAVVIGAIVGWVASLIVGGSGSGFWADVMFGIGGSILAGWVLPLFGLQLGIVGGLIASLIGAIVLILIVRAIRKSS